MLWCIVRLAQTTCFGKRAAVFEKSWDVSNDLKSTDIKIKLIFSKPTNSSLSKYFFLCQETRLYLLTLLLCSWKNSTWREGSEQVRILRLGYLLNNITSLSLISYLPLVITTKRKMVENLAHVLHCRWSFW